MVVVMTTQFCDDYVQIELGTVQFSWVKQEGTFCAYKQLYSDRKASHLSHFPFLSLLWSEFEFHIIDSYSALLLSTLVISGDLKWFQNY